MFSKPSHTPAVLPGLRPSGTINRKHLWICRALVQLSLGGVSVRFDEPGQGVPILLSCRTCSDLVPPCLATHLGFVHAANICADSDVRSPPRPRSGRSGLGH